MPRRAISSLAFAALTCASAGAQVDPAPVRYFPFTPMRVEAGEVVLEPEIAAMHELVELRAVVLDGVVDAGGRMVRLELERAYPLFTPGAVHVDGVAQAESVPAGTSFWAGEIQGVVGSSAFLAISPFGTRGWFGTPQAMNHLLAQPTGGDWSRARLRVVSAHLLAALGEPPLWKCEALQTERAAPPVDRRGRSAESGGPTPIYNAPIAFETTYEYFATFGNLGAAQVYTAALIGAISNLYRQEVGVIFTIPYLGFHTANNDPWTPTNCRDMNLEFQAAWSGSGAPVRAALYHLITSHNCGGGIAYLNALCNRDFAFGVSGAVVGQTPFPPAQGPLSWDFVVMAHEIGHGFGAIHTHAYVPPVDGCGNGNCANPAGTLMSYCHSCAGGMANIALTFHPQSAADMRATVLESCLRTLAATNDECATAVRIVEGQNGPFHNGAASDSQPTWPCGGVASSDLWYSFLALCTGDLTLETCGAGTDFDTKIEVFAGTCGALVSLGCNDDACGGQGLFSRVVVPIVQGETYLVRVGGFDGTAGNFVLNAACDGITQYEYQVAWKLAITPDRTSGLLAVKTTDTGPCLVDAVGTFDAGSIQDGTWSYDSRGKVVAQITLADLQRIADQLYGPSVVQIESIVLAKTKLQHSSALTSRTGKVKFTANVQALFNGGKLLKIKVSFGGLED